MSAMRIAARLRTLRTKHSINAHEHLPPYQVACAAVAGRRWPSHATSTRAPLFAARRSFNASSRLASSNPQSWPESQTVYLRVSSRSSLCSLFPMLSHMRPEYTLREDTVGKTLFRRTSVNVTLFTRINLLDVRIFMSMNHLVDLFCSLVVQKSCKINWFHHH